MLEVKIVECRQGSVFNSSTGKCDKTSCSIGSCPPERSFYNAVIMTCTQYPKDKPNFDPETNQCLSALPPLAHLDFNMIHRLKFVNNQQLVIGQLPNALLLLLRGVKV